MKYFIVLISLLLLINCGPKNEVEYYPGDVIHFNQPREGCPSKGQITDVLLDNEGLIYIVEVEESEGCPSKETVRHNEVTFKE